MLRAFARQVGAPPNDVDDVVQSALVNFIRFYPGEAGDYQGAKRYLFSCIASATSKLHRRNFRKPTPAPLPGVDRARDTLHPSKDTEQVSLLTAPGPDEIVIDRVLDAELRALLEHLPAEQTACLLLGAAGYGLAEIAERLGLSERQVRKRVGKANAKLRALR